MRYINFENIIKVRKKGYARHIPQIIKPTSTFCDECQREKQTKVSFKTKEYSTTRQLELVHTDGVGLLGHKISMVRDISCFLLMNFKE